MLPGYVVRCPIAYSVALSINPITKFCSATPDYNQPLSVVRFGLCHKVIRFTAQPGATVENS